jgi:hypothetical protein
MENFDQPLITKRRSQKSKIGNFLRPSDGKKSRYLAMFETGGPRREIADIGRKE